MSLRAFSAVTLTEVLAGRALNMVSSPVKGLIPLRALRAGFLTVFILSRPGRVNSPTLRFLMWRSITVVNSLNTSLIWDLFKPVLSAISETIWDLVYLFWIAVTFFAGAAFLTGAAFLAEALVAGFLTTFFTALDLLAAALVLVADRAGALAFLAAGFFAAICFPFMVDSGLSEYVADPLKNRVVLHLYPPRRYI